jgi:hypothetical protein
LAIGGIKVPPGNDKVPVDLLLSGVEIAEASYAILELDAL